MFLSPTVLRLLASLDDSIRSDFQDVRETSFNWLLVSTVVVAFGVIAEGPEVIEEFKEEIERFLHWPSPVAAINLETGLPIVRHRLKWKKMLSAIGWLLIVVGVAAEGLFEAEVSSADARLQTFETSLLTETNRRIAEASVKAGDANEQASRLSIDLEGERQKTARFQKEAAMARLALEQQLISQGPRVKLLYGKNRDKLIERLKPFAGQSAEIRLCEISFNQSSVDQETVGVAILLAFIKKGSGWLGEEYPVRRPACGGTGIDVSISPKASPLAKASAEAFRNALAKIPLSVFPHVNTISAANDPIPLDLNTVVVTVFSHP